MVANTEGKRPKSVKVGHSGTLDPFATGLLILLIGRDYTRQAIDFSLLDKTYEVTMKLGETSTTGDPEGIITAISNIVPDIKTVRSCIKDLTGTISQVPPVYSAIKVNGQRSYKLARAGKEVMLEPRSVVISRIQVEQYVYPEVMFVADVSSGTYIRSLVETFGEMLQTGAYTTALRRTRIGDYLIDNAQKTEDLDAEKLRLLLEH